MDEGAYLLTENEIIVDETSISDSKIHSLILQRPNAKLPIFGLALGLHFYNLAKPDPQLAFDEWLNRKPKRKDRLIKLLSEKQLVALDSSYVNFNKWIKRSGEEPSVIRDDRISRSSQQLERYYKSFGWFNTEVESRILASDKHEKRAKVVYDIKRKKAYKIGDIKHQINSPIVHDLFDEHIEDSYIQEEKQYSAEDFVKERRRITDLMRNSGLYHFDQDYVGFEADTIKTGQKADITYIIPDRIIKTRDSSYTEPFQVHKINTVEIVSDYSYENRDKVYSDTTHYKGYTFYSYDKLRFKPKTLTSVIAIKPGEIFRDTDRSLSYRQIGDLRMFQYPSITYTESKDSDNTLDARILLTPRKKFTLGFDFDSYTSTIQEFGMGFSSNIRVRNVFRRAELLEITGRGAVGSSKDAAKSEKFFNISEVGGDIKLSFPRILFPINLEGLIPKSQSPITTFGLGFSTQNNIGLDRKGINGRLSYQWEPTPFRTNILELLNTQYVRHLNTANYYHVYKNSYNRLNDIANSSSYDFNNPDESDSRLEIPQEVNDFIGLALSNPQQIGIDDMQRKEVQSIAERHRRLTENNLIIATNYTWIRDSRQNILDNNFTRIQVRLESAGGLMSILSRLSNAKKNNLGQYNPFGVVFSQYAKLDASLIKHWEIDIHNTIAFRAFGGLAIPYGNSKSIPFTRSYFAGGTNDNRGWRAYDLGPGRSGSVLDFNEANFKLAFNAEYRFTLLGAFKGALFVDAGNIWNVMDDVTDDRFTFTGIKDLKDLAVATGFGLRYDFDFFVFRLDTGFKTYNPSLEAGKRWFKNYNFRNAVYNIGINYPF